MGRKTILTENDICRMVKDAVERLLHESYYSDGNYPMFDDLFDLRRIPKDILSSNFVSYSPYRLSASCDSRLQRDCHSVFICEAIDDEINVDNAIEEITRTFPIDEVYQVTKQKGEHGLYAALLIANVQGNVQTIVESMARYKMFPSKDMPSTILSDGNHTWIDIRFEPSEQEDVSNEIRNLYSALGHLSPSVNEQSILMNGLVGSNNNPVYKYPSPRVHLIEGNASEEDIQQLANTLYAQARQKGIKGLTPEYTLFSIDLSKVPESTCFYWDINETYGLFTDTDIPARAIRRVKRLIAK